MALKPTCKADLIIATALIRPAAVTGRTRGTFFREFVGHNKQPGELVYRDGLIFDEDAYDDFTFSAKVKMVGGAIERYALPHLGALNFVMHDALAGGVTRSLALDAHGKCLSAAILDLPIDIPERAAHPPR